MVEKGWTAPNSMGSVRTNQRRINGIETTWISSGKAKLLHA